MKKVILYLFTNIFISNFINAQTWVWAKNTGGNNTVEETVATKTDATGNVYAAGIFSGSTVTFGTYTLSNASSSGTPDIFLVKYNTSGSVLWAKRAGGINYEQVSGLTIDASGNIIITGTFDSNSITFGTNTLIKNGSYNDIYTTKYDSNGNVLWAKQISGPDDDRTYSVCSDAASNIYLVGTYSSYTLTAGSFSLINSTQSFSTYDGFIVKYNSAGNTAWVQNIGTTTLESENVQTVVSDVSGANIYVVGSIEGSAVVGTTTLTTSSNLNRDLFFAKYNASTGAPIFANLITGDGLEIAKGMTRDGSNNIYITGTFDGGTMSFGSNSINNVSATTKDLFIAKYNTSGIIQWVKSEGNSSEDEANNICNDASGNIFICGTFKSNTITFGSTTLTNTSPNTYYDAFLAKYNSSGTSMFAIRLGGTNNDWVNSITVDASSNIYVGGGYTSPSISFGAITLTNTASGYSDAYIAKYGSTTTGIENIEKNNNFSIYPNPNTGSFSIKVVDCNYNLKIMNNLGQLFYNEKIENRNSVISIKDLVAGIYYAILEKDGYYWTEKVIVQ